MRWGSQRLRQWGYSDFTGFSAEAEGIRFREAVVKDDAPFVVIGDATGRKVPDYLLLPDLPETVQYVITEGERAALYGRSDRERFVERFTLPKSDGTIWGQHARADLIPLVDLQNAVDHARGPFRGSHDDAVGFLLGLKLLDEASSDATLCFRLPEADLDRAETIVAGWMSAFELGEAWSKIPAVPGDTLGRLIMAWQPYRFLSATETEGVFSLLFSLLTSREGIQASTPSSLVRLIHALIPGTGEPLCIAGTGASGLLDIPLLADKSAVMVGHGHPVLEKVSEALLTHCEWIPQDCPDLELSRRWPAIICIPPFGGKVTDSRLLDRSEIARRGQDKHPVSARSEEIWLEQGHRLLEDGGIMFVVLNDGFLSNASSRFGREWALERFRIEAVFSLPASMFSPASSVKTSLVCMRKAAQPSGDYRIFMAELDESDCEHLGEIIAAYRETREERR